MDTVTAVVVVDRESINKDITVFVDIRSIVTTVTRRTVYVESVLFAFWADYFPLKHHKLFPNQNYHKK